MPIGDGGIDHGSHVYGNPNAAQAQQQARYNQTLEALQQALQREQANNQTIQTLQAQCQQLIQQRQGNDQAIKNLQDQCRLLSQQNQMSNQKIEELNDKVNDLTAEINKLDEDLRNPFDKLLLQFSEEGDVKKLAATIQLGADIDATNSEGQTPLFLSIKNNRLDVAQILIDLKASIDVTDKNNIAILDMLCDQLPSKIKDQQLSFDFIESLKDALKDLQVDFNERLEAYKSMPNDHLVAYYPYKGNAYDESHHGNDGVAYGATLVSDRFGSENSAYYFDGNSYITSKVEDFPRGERTISLWFKPEIYNINSKTDRGGTLFGYSGIRCSPEDNIYDNSTNLIFGINRALDSCPDRENNYDAYVWGEPIGITCSQNMYGTPSIWNHLVLTSNNNTGLAIYLNGEKIAEDPRSLQTIGVITDFAIGSWVLFNTPGSSSDDPRFRGAIDEVRVYDCCLNKDEIEHLYKVPTKDDPVEYFAHKIEQISQLVDILEKSLAQKEADKLPDINKQSADTNSEEMFKKNDKVSDNSLFNFFSKREIFNNECQKDLNLPSMQN